MIVNGLEKTSQFIRIISILVPVFVVLGKSIERPPVTKQYFTYEHQQPTRNASKMATLESNNKSSDNNTVSNIPTNIYNKPRFRHETRQRRHLQENQIIFGMSLEYDGPKKRIDYRDSGKVIIMESTVIRIRLFGSFNRSEHHYMSFTRVYGLQAGACNPQHSTTEISVTILEDYMAFAKLTMPTKAEIPDKGYLCFRRGVDNASFLQGPKDWLTIELDTKLLPLWLHVMCIILLLCLSGLFSGLNLGLMSLNKTDLKIIINTGTIRERSYASQIAPVRNHGNFLLCCLLFSNVLVNTTLTILMDDMTSGEVAIICSTIAIVIFGEIVPQAICSRYGLAVGAKTIYITKFFMLITFPLAYPLSKILDRVLGEEIGSVYTRERLKELLKVTKDHHGLETEEVGIISGALEMKTKTVKDVMTKLECVYMLPSDAVLTFDTMAEIEYHGYSRIPIYENERNNIVAVLNVKQLTLLDPSDNIPLRTVIEYHHSEIFYVFDYQRLDFLFRAFRDGKKGHMAFVQKVRDEGPGDPYYETVGIVTMEDVLEELLQAEIMDESDVGKLQARVGHTERPKNIPFMLNKKAKPIVEIPPSLAMAAVQFLSSSVEPFKKEYITVNILERLIRTTIVFVKAPRMKHHGEAKTPHTYIYEQGKPADYFVMIVEGRVEVCVGIEKMTYESGPFTIFGADFLMANQTSQKIDSENNKESAVAVKRSTFSPDYTVRVITDVTYFRLKLSAYRAAVTASSLVKNYKDPIKAAGMGDWEDEIEKVLNDAEDEVNEQESVETE